MHDEIAYQASGHPDPGDAAYDVFISYSQQDQAWVCGPLLERLEAYDVRVCLDVRDFQPGAPLITEVERAVSSSRFTLIVLTPHWIQSTWTEFADVLAYTLAHGFKQRRIIPLIKAACVPPPRIQALTAVDFTDPTTHERAYTRLLAALDCPQRSRQVAPATPATIPAATPEPVGARLSHQPDQRFLTINALADQGRVLGQKLARAKVGFRHITVAEACSWQATYTAWAAECLSVLDADLQPRFRNPHQGNADQPGVERLLTLLVQACDPDPGIAEPAQRALRPTLRSIVIDELLYPQQDLLETARRRAFPATHAVSSEIKDVIAASQRRFTNGRIDYVFGNAGCESHWWLRPLRWYERKSERQVHGWLDAIQVYAPERERTIVRAVCREVLREGRVVEDQRGVIEAYLR